jgi:hypothetical protein
MADSREVLTELFERELARVEQFAPVKIEVIYMPPADYRRETLRTWRREDPKDAWAFGDAAPYRTKLITTIIELAEQRAEHDGTGTKKLFRVVVHQAGGERVPGTFTVLPMFDGADAALERDEHGDAASPTGTLAMVMRQNRDLHKAILARAKQDDGQFAHQAPRKPQRSPVGSDRVSREPKDQTGRARRRSEDHVARAHDRGESG